MAPKSVLRKGLRGDKSVKCLSTGGMSTWFRSSAARTYGINQSKIYAAPRGGQIVVGDNRQYQREPSPNDRRLYEAAEDATRADKRGLWRDADPMPPWEFRHSKTKP